jgi:AcrR family transcriptional regulator
MTLGLRERHKQRRRDAILQAARDLLREGGPGELTKERLAARAEVAPATVYNLMGTRAGLWAALADDFMAELERRLAGRPAADPVARIRQVVELVVELFVEDREVSRQMLRGWEDSGLILRRGPASVLIVLSGALAAAQAAGVLVAGLDARRLASSIATACVGAVHQWAAGRIDDRRFRRRARLAVDVALAAAATPRHRARLQEALS